MSVKITKERKQILLGFGETEESIPQIREALKKTVYTLLDPEGVEKRISAEKALDILGERTFLSGISRSAFHWTAARESEDGKQKVYFDSSKLFRDSL